MRESRGSKWETWESDSQVVGWNRSRAKVGSSGSLISRFNFRAIAAASQHSTPSPAQPRGCVYIWK